MQYETLVGMPLDEFYEIVKCANIISKDNQTEMRKVRGK